MPESESEKELFDQDPDHDEDFIRYNKEWPFSESGDLDDVPTPTGVACAKISTVLCGASEHAGDFSFGGQASQLPAIPGLVIDGVGPVPIPIWDGVARKLIAKCEQSPFGHRMDTKMDEQIRKSWQLAPEFVHFNNPRWSSGISEMAVSIADKLGYKDMPLECKLYKLLVYEEGGHFAKHQDTEKADGMIATLVIQPPSLHEGGDLVIYCNDVVKHRHDFGKAEGTASYLPHYAVHYADVEHQVEKVTKGYRLALVFSVCLPLTMQHLERNPNKPMSAALTEAINTMVPGDDTFTLLLSHQYTPNSIKKLGTKALKRVDRARFLALDEANASVLPENKLEFYIAQLVHKVDFYGSYGTIGDWDEEAREEKATWYSRDGKALEGGDVGKLKLNFLNPEQESRSRMWSQPFGSSDMHGYLGNEGPTKHTTYSRYAIVAWPLKDCLKNTIKMIGLERAEKLLKKQQQVEAALLRDLINATSEKLADMDEAMTKKTLKDQGLRASVLAHQKLFKDFARLMAGMADSDLVKLLFSTLYSHLHPKLGTEASAVMVLKTVPWADVEQCVINSFPESDENVIRTLVDVAKKFDRGDAQHALLALAVEKSRKMIESCSSNLIRDLWEMVLCHGDDAMVDALGTTFQHMSPRFLVGAITAFSHLMKKNKLRNNAFGLFVSILTCRMDWLMAQVDVLKKPFSWIMPVAECPGAAELERFLHGPEASNRVTNMIFKYQRKAYQINASFTVYTKRHEVEITKTKDWYDQTKPKLSQLEKELNDLTEERNNAVIAAVSLRKEV